MRTPCARARARAHADCRPRTRSAAFILKVFGGIVEDLRAFLLEERLPDGWEPRVRHRAGLTMIEINLTIGKVEFGVEEEVDGSMTAPRPTASIPPSDSDEKKGL